MPNFNPQDELLGWQPSELTRLHVPQQDTVVDWLLAIERTANNRLWIGADNAVLIHKDGELTHLPSPVTEALRADAYRLHGLLAAELSGATRAREKAESIRKLWTTTPLEEGRFRAATEILEAFDGE